MFIVLRNLEHFILAGCPSGIAEYQGQTPYTRILQGKPFIDTSSLLGHRLELKYFSLRNWIPCKLCNLVALHCRMRSSKICASMRFCSYVIFYLRKLKLEYRYALQLKNKMMTGEQFWKIHSKHLPKSCKGKKKLLVKSESKLQWILIPCPIKSINDK